MRQFAVREAGTVADAHGVLSPAFSWILLDLMLPDGNGLDVLRRVKREGLPTKVCVISGCCSEMFDEARRCGADETLVKPVDVKHLLNVLSTAVAAEAAAGTAPDHLRTDAAVGVGR